MNMQRLLRNLWFWLGASLLLIVFTLAIQGVSRRATTASIPDTGAAAPVVQPQSVPEAAVQSVTDYLEAHSDSSAQAVPEAGVQSVSNYINAHSNPSAQTVPDPAVQSVMDYLKAHGIQP